MTFFYNVSRSKIAIDYKVVFLEWDQQMVLSLKTFYTKVLNKQDATWTEDSIWTIMCVCACFHVSTLKSLSMIALLAQPEGHMASLHLPGGVFYPTLPFCTFTTLHRRATGLISDWWAPPPPFPQWNMPFGTSAKVCWVAHARSPNQKTLMCDWERDTHWTVDF